MTVNSNFANFSISPQNSQHLLSESRRGLGIQTFSDASHFHNKTQQHVYIFRRFCSGTGHTQFLWSRKLVSYTYQA